MQYWKKLILLSIILQFSLLYSDELTDILNKLAQSTSMKKYMPNHYICLINENTYIIKHDNKLKKDHSTLMKFEFFKPNIEKYTLISTNAPDSNKLKKQIKHNTKTDKKNPFLPEMQKFYNFSLVKKVKTDTLVLYTIKVEAKKEDKKFLNGFFVVDSANAYIIKYNFQPSILPFLAKELHISGTNSIVKHKGFTYIVKDSITVNVHIKIPILYSKKMLIKRKYYNYKFIGEENDSLSQH